MDGWLVWLGGRGRGRCAAALGVEMRTDLWDLKAWRESAGKEGRKEEGKREGWKERRRERGRKEGKEQRKEARKGFIHYQPPGVEGGKKCVKM